MDNLFNEGIELQGLLSDKDLETVSDIERTIAEYYGKDAELVDNKIDDGCDGSDDEYVMCACFETDNRTIRAYYGNNTLSVGYVRVDER